MLVFRGVFETGILHPDLGDIKRGTISYEYYWLDRWYNVFCFYEPDGAFRNHYCNINMPPVFEDTVLDYVDLDIDVVAWPEGNLRILDEAEYAENSVKFSYPEALRTQVSAALAEIVAMIKNRRLPDPQKFLQPNG